MTRHCAGPVVALCCFAAYAATEPPVNEVTPKGALLDWVLLGPFETRPLARPLSDGVTRSGYHRDFLEALGGEAKAVLSPDTIIRYRTEAGGERVVRARRVGPVFESRESPVLRHIREDRHIIEQDFDQAVAYAFCQVRSDRDQEVFAYFSSNGSPKIYVNGELVHRLFQEERQGARWQDAFRLKLKEGLNPVLVKVDNRRGYWGIDLELYEREHHAAAIARLGPRLAVEPVAAGGRGLSVRTRLDPPPLDFTVPVSVRATAPDGRVIAEVRGVSGHDLPVEIPENFTGEVRVDAWIADGFLAGGGKPVSMRTYAGDFQAAAAGLRPRFEAAVRDLGFLGESWRRIYAGAIEWGRRFLARDFPVAGWWALDSLQYLKDLTVALEQHRNFLAEHPGRVVPMRFEGRDTRGSAEAGDYQLYLPAGFAPEGRRYPLFVSLHGSLRSERKITFGEKPSAAAYTDFFVNAGEPAAIGANPIGPFPFVGWRVEYLNVFLAVVKSLFPIDEDRIYLQGGSGGGKGLWNWTMSNPEHFAAAAAMCAFADHPYRASRLRTVPVWMFNGELDLASRAFQPEAMSAALRRAGGEAKYTLFPALGHSLSPGVDKAALRTWLLEHERARGPAPPDPVLALQAAADAGKQFQLVDVPAKTVAGLIDEERFLYPQDNVYRTTMKLFEAYRMPTGETPHRRAGGVVMIRKPADAAGEEREMLLEPEQADWQPVGPLVAVRLPAIRAARIIAYGTWADLERARDILRAELTSRRLRPTGEERALVHSLTDVQRPDKRVYELQLALDAP